MIILYAFFRVYISVSNGPFDLFTDGSIGRQHFRFFVIEIEIFSFDRVNLRGRNLFGLCTRFFD